MNILAEYQVIQCSRMAQSGLLYTSDRQSVKANPESLADNFERDCENIAFYFLYI